MRDVEFRHESTAVTTIAFMMSAEPGMPMVSSAAMKGESPSLVLFHGTMQTMRKMAST